MANYVPGTCPLKLTTFRILIVVAVLEYVIILLLILLFPRKCAQFGDAGKDLLLNASHLQTTSGAHPSSSPRLVSAHKTAIEQISNIDLRAYFCGNGRSLGGRERMPGRSIMVFFYRSPFEVTIGKREVGASIFRVSPVFSALAYKPNEYRCFRAHLSSAGYFSDKQKLCISARIILVSHETFRRM